MYPAPPSQKTEVFARIPDTFRKRGQLSAERIAAGKGTLNTDCFIEGPSFDLEGNLYLVDIAFGRVFRVNPSGHVALITEYDGEPNGLKIHRDGRIFITDHKRGLLLLDPATGDVTPVVERYMTEGFKGLNDLFIDRSGNIYFTDQGQSNIEEQNGRVYRLQPSGRVDRLLSNMPSPNGIVMSPNEKLVYIAATRSNSIWRAAITAEGDLARTGVFIHMSGGTGPDGMAMDSAGNLAVAHVGAGIVWLFSPMGIPILRIDSCQGHGATNLAYGGVDHRTLYITESESGCVLTTRLETPGQVMHSHQKL
jgi:gluconolactonase